MSNNVAVLVLHNVTLPLCGVIKVTVALIQCYKR